MARGLDWEFINLDPNVKYIYDVTYIPDKGFLASISHTSFFYIFSPDGRTWSLVGGKSSGSIYGVASHHGKVVGVGASGKVYISSDTDIGTLTVRETYLSTNLTSVTYGNGVWVSVGNSSSIATSIDDGESWTFQKVNNAAFRPITFRKVIYIDDIGFFAFGAKGTWEGTAIFHSVDGLTWNEVTSGSIMPFGATGACKGKDKLIAVYGITDSISQSFERSAYSLDGFSWSSGNLDTSNMYAAVCMGKDDEGKTQYVSVGVVTSGSSATNNYIIALSDNGINWTKTIQSYSSIITWGNIIYVKGIYIAVGSTNTSQGVLMVSGEFDPNETDPNEPEPPEFSYKKVGRLRIAIVNTPVLPPGAPITLPPMDDTFKYYIISLQEYNVGTPIYHAEWRAEVFDSNEIKYRPVTGSNWALRTEKLSPGVRIRRYYWNNSTKTWVSSNPGSIYKNPNGTYFETNISNKHLSTNFPLISITGEIGFMPTYFKVLNPRRVNQNEFNKIRLYKKEV